MNKLLTSISGLNARVLAARSRLRRAGHVGLKCLSGGRAFAVCVLAQLVLAAPAALAQADPVDDPDGFIRICWNGQKEGEPNCRGALIPNYSDKPSGNPETDWACTLDRRAGLMWSLQVRSHEGEQYGSVDANLAEELDSGPTTGHGDMGRCGKLSRWRVPGIEETVRLLSRGVEGLHSVLGAGVDELVSIIDEYPSSKQYGFWSKPSSISRGEDSVSYIFDVVEYFEWSGVFFQPIAITMSLSIEEPRFYGNPFPKYVPVWTEYDYDDESGNPNYQVEVSYNSTVNYAMRLDDPARLANTFRLDGHDDWRMVTVEDYISSVTTRRSITPVRHHRLASDLKAAVFHVIRGGWPGEKEVKEYLRAKDINVIPAPGSDVSCNESEDFLQDPKITCRSTIQDEAFALIMRDNVPFGRMADANCTFASGVNTKYMMKEVAEDEVLTVFPSAVGENCYIKFTNTQQIRSLARTQSQPMEGGEISCMGISPHSEGWVTLGDKGTCKATPSPGYELTSIDGCDGTYAGVGPYITGELQRSCTVIAHFKRSADSTGSPESPSPESPSPESPSPESPSPQSPSPQSPIAVPTMSALGWLLMTFIAAAFGISAVRRSA